MAAKTSLAAPGAPRLAAPGAPRRDAKEMGGRARRGRSADPDATRARIVAACERLFAERGIERVSLNEIVAAAGQRNASAIHYHFGDREGLMERVLCLPIPSELAEGLAETVARLEVIGMVCENRPVYGHSLVPPALHRQRDSVLGQIPLYLLLVFDAVGIHGLIPIRVGEF